MDFKVSTIFTFFFTLVAAKAKIYSFKDINDFVWLAGEPYFIDKTEMLKVLFDNTTLESPYHYVTCPYNFGKRKNLYMVKKFAEMELNENGEPKCFTETDALQVFKQLKIADHSHVIRAHLAKYSVIFMDLSISHVGTKEDLYTLLKHKLRNSVSNYKWVADLLQKKIQKAKSLFNIDEDDVNFFYRLFQDELTDRELEDGIYRVSKVLYQFFNESKVILLMDEYENAALHSIASLTPNVVYFYEKLDKMLTNMITKGHMYIKTALITGTGSLGFYTDSNTRLLGFTMGQKKTDTITHHAFLNDHKFTKFFGALEEDIDQLCVQYECNFTESNLIRKLIRGYSTVPKKSIGIYNPSSVAWYFQNNHHPPSRFLYSSNLWVDPRWQRLIEPFMKAPLFREKMDDLFTNGAFQYPITKKYAPNSLKELISLASERYKKIKDKHVDMFFNICFEQGYFSHAPGKDMFTVPNDNVRVILKLNYEKYYYADSEEDASFLNRKLKLVVTEFI